MDMEASQPGQPSPCQTVSVRWTDGSCLTEIRKNNSIYCSHVAGHITWGAISSFPLTLGGQEFYTRNRYLTKILQSIILWGGQIHVSFFTSEALPPVPPCSCVPDILFAHLEFTWKRAIPVRRDGIEKRAHAQLHYFVLAILFTHRK